MEKIPFIYNIYYLKALHVIFMATWFAGLFFLGRLFIYDKEAEEKSSTEKEILHNVLRKGQKNTVYIIVWPSLIITFTLGLWLMHLLEAYKEGWFHFKFLFVLGLIGYTFFSANYRKKIIKAKHSFSKLKLRIINEMPAIFLFIIVFTVYAKDWFSGLWALSIFCLIVGLIIFGFKNFSRKKSKN